MQAWRNQNNEFAFDGGYVSINDSFNATMKIIDDDISHSCIEARFDPNATKLKLYSYDCPYETSGVVCQMYSNQQVSCNDGISSSTGSPAGGSSSTGSPSGGSSPGGGPSGSGGGPSGSSSSSSTGSPSPSTSTSGSQTSSGNSQGNPTGSSGSSSTTTSGSGSGPNYARNKRNGNYEDDENDDDGYSGFEFHDPLDLMMNPDLQTEFKKSINLLRKTMKDAFVKVI